MNKMKYALMVFFAFSVFIVFQNCGRELKIERYLDKTTAASTSEEVISPPVISFITENQTLIEGQPLNLVVSATGGLLQYKWFKNSVEIESATPATYSVANVTTSDAGTYMVTISNPAGESNAEIIVTVNPLLAQTTACLPLELEQLNASAGQKSLLNDNSYSACMPSACIDNYTLYGSACYKNTITTNISNGTKTETFSPSTGAYTTDYQCAPGTRVSLNTAKDGASECLTVCYGWVNGAPTGSDVPPYSQYIQGHLHAELHYSNIQSGPITCRVYVDQFADCRSGPAATALYNQCKDPNGCLMKTTLAEAFKKYPAENTPINVGQNNNCGYTLY